MKRAVLSKAAVVAGAVVAFLVLLPVLERIVLLGVVVLAAGVVVTILAVATLGNLARRHPIVDLAIGAWLVHRHERRMRRAIGARNSSARSRYASPWAPPDPRTRARW
ncbi:MAG: hypothetical protein M0010_19005 [Actinomycetota bacterium]|nr:hypothetical protein [Actinomycetota bacterium]MDA8356281.1 hypothetical protein [Actinomycetota bacterium]